jgi:hypothetical protein
MDALLIGMTLAATVSIATLLQKTVLTLILSWMARSQTSHRANA